MKLKKGSKEKDLKKKIKKLMIQLVENLKRRYMKIDWENEEKEFKWMIILMLFGRRIYRYTFFKNL